MSTSKLTIGKDETIAVGDRLYDNYGYTETDRHENRVVEVVSVEGEAPNDRVAVKVVGGLMASDATRQAKATTLSRKTLRGGYRRFPADVEIIGYHAPD